MRSSTNARALLVIGMLIFCSPACTPEQGGTTTVIATASATPAPMESAVVTSVSTHVALPRLTLEAGEFYFSMDGQPALIFSRNIAGYQVSQYSTFLGWERSGGSRVARIQLDSMGMGYTRTGEVDRAWLEQWDRVFAKAEEEGIYILPVFSGWFDWNGGAGYSTWATNPLNAANGGPIDDPAQLLDDKSAAQEVWLRWMGQLVQHWQGQNNILGWEIFSEVNLASGANEAAATSFVNRAAQIIRQTDRGRRPITASLADTGTWLKFYREADLDFVSIHPYPPSGKLDQQIITETRAYLAAYKRPVLIGESGLSAATPDSEDGRLTVSDRAAIGVRHAIWAAVVSGAMNGRALYWEDSFGIYFSQLGMTYLEQYKDAELAAAKFVDGVDFSGMRPLGADNSAGIWGAALGNENTILGWYRDADSEPPDWPLQATLSGQTVTIAVPGSNYAVVFYDTRTGLQVGSQPVSAASGKITIVLPDFTDAIAFRAVRQ